MASVFENPLLRYEMRKSKIGPAFANPITVLSAIRQSIGILKELGFFDKKKNLDHIEDLQTRIEQLSREIKNYLSELNKFEKS